MGLFLSSCLSFQTRTDLLLVKLYWFYYSAAIRSFLKTFRKFAGKQQWWKSFLGNFKLLKMDSGKGVFPSVFQTPFCGCFQTLNRNTFLWMIMLFGTNIPESSKICQKVKAIFCQILRNTWAREILFSLRANFTNFLKCILL